MPKIKAKNTKYLRLHPKNSILVVCSKDYSVVMGRSTKVNKPHKTGYHNWQIHHENIYLVQNIPSGIARELDKYLKEVSRDDKEIVCVIDWKNIVE